MYEEQSAWEIEVHISNHPQVFQVIAHLSPPLPIPKREAAETASGAQITNSTERGEYITLVKLTNNHLLNCSIFYIVSLS